VSTTITFADGTKLVVSEDLETVRAQLVRVPPPRFIAVTDAARGSSVLLGLDHIRLVEGEAASEVLLDAMGQQAPPIEMHVPGVLHAPLT
jgi:hypothetical protein